MRQTGHAPGLCFMALAMSVTALWLELRASSSAVCSMRGR